MAEILAIAIVAVTIALIILVRGWVRAPGAEIVRARKVGVLWYELGCLRYALSTKELTHFERDRLSARAKEIENELVNLGIPKESLT